MDLEKQQNTELTMLVSIASIVSLAKGSKLSDDFLKNAELYIDYLAKRQGISKIQALLFSLFVETSAIGERVDFSDIARFLNCHNVEILQYANEVEELVRMGLLHKKTDPKGVWGFVIPQSLLNGLAKDEIYHKKSYKDASDIGIFQQLFEITHLRYENELSTELLLEEVQRLLDENPNLAFVKSLRQTGLTDMDEIIIAHMCRHLVTDGTENVPINHISFLYDSGIDKKFFEHQMTNGYHDLIAQKWIEYAHTNGFRDMDSFRLTEKARETLLANYVIHTAERKGCDILHYQEIAEKELFFDVDVSKQLDCPVPRRI